MSYPDQAGKPKIAIVIAAAGRSRRFGTDKLAELLGEVTVLERACSALREALPDAPQIVVVAADRVEHWRAVLYPGSSGLEVTAGGPRRQDSVRLGVARAKTRGAEIVAVHDGARPIVHGVDVRAVVEAARGLDGAVLCVAPVDTVKRVDADGIIVETLERSSIRLAQTPQVFLIDRLERAWRRRNMNRDFSDEASLLEADGCSLCSVIARHPNPKITTTEDLEPVRALIGCDP